MPNRLAVASCDQWITEANYRTANLETPRARSGSVDRNSDGLILIFMCPPPLPDTFSTSQSRQTFTWTFSDANGQSDGVSATAFFLPDVGVVAFGIILMLDGLLLVFARSAALCVGDAWPHRHGDAAESIALGTSMNEIGFQILPALAVAFGGYMVVYQWRLVQMHRAAGK